MITTKPIDIEDAHADILQNALKKHLPEGVRVYAFGSRANWQAKRVSDLDLAIDICGFLKINITDLEEELNQSNLPYKVDIVNLASISDSFRAAIESDLVPILWDWKDAASTEVNVVIDPLWKSYVAGDSANAKQLASFEIPVPPLLEQKAIAAVLSSLDDKIGLLYRQNKTLEAIVETLTSTNNPIKNNFDKITQSLFKKIEHNIHQIKTLGCLHDALLPKLMSGDVRVEVRWSP